MCGIDRNGGLCLAIAEPRGHREPERNTTGCEQDVRVHRILRRMTLTVIDATADQLRRESQRSCRGERLLDEPVEVAIDYVSRFDSLLEA